MATILTIITYCSVVDGIRTRTALSENQRDYPVIIPQQKDHSGVQLSACQDGPSHADTYRELITRSEAKFFILS